MEENVSLVTQQPTELVDSLCREATKSLNKKIFELTTKCEYLEELIQNLKIELAWGDMHSKDQDQLFTALSNAKAAMIGDFEKTGVGARNKVYANLDDVTFVAKPILKEHGLDIIQEPIGENFLKTTITHSSGQWRSSTLNLNPDFKNFASTHQARLAALTYMKRGVYVAILGLSTSGD